MSIIILRGKYVLLDAGNQQAGLLTDAGIAVSGATIVAAGDFQALRGRWPEAAVIGNGRQFLMPGLMDAHSHGRGLSPLQKGVGNDFLENNLFDWAFMPVFDPELTAALCALRHIRSGCTAVHHNAFDMDGPQAADIASRTIRTYQQSGIRLAFSPSVRNADRVVLDGKNFLDTLPADLREWAAPLMTADSQAMEDEYFALFEQLYRAYNGETTRILVSPSWAQACTESFLRRAKETADRLGKLPLHMHCLQTPVQKAFSLRKYGKTAVEYLDGLGLLDDNTVLAHAIWVTERDIDLLAARRTSVTSHVSCNLAMRNGLAPLRTMLDKGINVAMGMDDKTVNDDEDAIMEMRMLYKMHRTPDYHLATPPLDAHQAVKMATVNAARVMGFAGTVGTLMPGMQADAVLVDLDRVLNDPWLSPGTGIVEAFVNRAMGEDVNTVMIAGRIVMDNRNIRTMDTDGLYRELRRTAQQGISSRQREFAQNFLRLKPYCQAWYDNWLGSEEKPFYLVNSRI